MSAMMAAALNRRLLLKGCTAGAALFAASTLPAAAQEQPAPATDLTAALAEVATPLGDRIIGDAKAPNVLVEYASATCSHCAHFAIDVLPGLKEKLIDTGRLQLVFREFPLDNAALAAFMLARCAPEDKYFPLMDLFFRRQSTWTTGDKAAELFRITQMAGFTEQSFKDCLQRKDYAAIISQAAKVAQQKLGLKGTPTFFLNGQKLEGYTKLEQLPALIESKLKT